MLIISQACWSKKIDFSLSAKKLTPIALLGKEESKKVEKAVVIVGAGLTGSTIARSIADKANSIEVLLIDKRNHVGGNIFDEYDNAGILIHRYGPHIFHTNNDNVVKFLSRFSKWEPYYHRVLTSVDGQLLPIPINLETMQRVLGRNNMTTREAKEYFESVRISTENPHNAADQAISQVGQIFYDKFFRGYTEKMWGLSPEKLDPSITGRIPVRINFDDRYFTDKYQFMPKYGYTHLVKSMLGHPNIHVLLQTEWKTVREFFTNNIIVYTGSIDEYFDYCAGRLAYRSLNFKFETYSNFSYQAAAVVNFPNDYDFTRITEYKRLTGQDHAQTTISREYPTSNGEPYYPVLTNENMDLRNLYMAEAEKLKKKVWFAGRLGTYAYLNMDAAVDQGLKMADDILSHLLS